MEKSTLEIPAKSASGVSAQAASVPRLMLLMRGFFSLFFIYFLLPNLLFVILGKYILLTRAVFNVDYLLLGVFRGTLGGAVSSVLYFLILALDALSSLCGIYNFNPFDSLAALPHVVNLKFSSVSGVAASVVLLASAISVLAVRIGSGKNRVVHDIGSALLIACLLFVVDVANGTNALRPRVDALFKNPVTSAFFTLVRDIRGNYSRNEIWAARYKNASWEDSATKNLAALARQVSEDGTVFPFRNVVFILVESYGFFNDQAENLHLSQLFESDSLKRRYRVRSGRVHFNGPTTAGEFRELCGVKAAYPDIPGENATGCLPWIFRKSGYKTISIHGYVPMFKRLEWYPRIGFEKILFTNESKDWGDFRRCGGVFDGYCDADMVPLLKDVLIESRTDRKFVYWLTLNSHFPVDAQSVKNSSWECTGRSPFERDSSVCRWMKIVHMTLGDIAKLAADPDLPPTYFVVVGDHRPPFVKKEDIELFSPDLVPYIELVPRSPSFP